MKLSKEERSAILAGEHPVLVRPYEDTCPFDIAEEVRLVSIPSLVGRVAQVSITITGQKRGAKGEWIAEYSVRDDRPLYLRRHSGATRSAAESLDPEAAITDEKTLEEYAIRGRLARGERHEATAEARRRRERAIRDRLRETLKGLDSEAQATLLASIEREIEDARNVSERAA